ncbi:uncharacterized protein LOC116002310 [Ipomoea triloba]|uniref:uncharacterized protein LOC116002310 n=1 Tax=Ipomoea triloba TaxID=35885 RepID=UPI00125D4DCF|nr:uncharacterized protein LOC116002310 [Ipomoea triloba]
MEEPVRDAPNSDLIADKRVRFPALRIRVPPLLFVEALEDLTAQQRKDICDIGFGDVLELKIKELPVLLGRWLLSNFYNEKMCVLLGEEEVLPVSEKDFEKQRHDVSPAKVAQLIREDLDGGLWFKRSWRSGGGGVGNFLLLFQLFFPILQQNHFYLLCVDFKSERLEITDNSASTQPTPVKYGDTPENVKLLLSEYFTFVGEKFKSIVCENLKTKRMPMNWRDTKNKVDYGVYLMRHMKSYVGEGVAKWDCGLTSGDRSQLQRLRLRYIYEGAFHS